ncbi:MAG: metallophosphoesterase family protein [Anaerolineae bacterium]|nr:metallophosphoesterase family protein [Anaerolineae bacterium]
MTTIAVIADIHGNVWALDAVLADIKHSGITTIINLGDHVYGPMAPAATLERIMREPMINISGNEDRCLFLPEDEATNFSSYHFVRSQLTADQLAWLEALPPTTIVGDIFCCHGTPDSDTTYMLETVTEHGVSLKAGELIYSSLKGIVQSVVVCGHSHIPRTTWLWDKGLLVNPGSVGWPAYNDNTPYPHAMETGSPHARYAILEKNGYDWKVEHIALKYDWAQAAAVCRQNGREDWAHWIETGRGK